MNDLHDIGIATEQRSRDGRAGAGTGNPAQAAGNAGTEVSEIDVPLRVGGERSGDVEGGIGLANASHIPLGRIRLGADQDRTPCPGDGHAGIAGQQGDSQRRDPVGFGGNLVIRVHGPEQLTRQPIEGVDGEASVGPRFHRHDHCVRGRDHRRPIMSIQSAIIGIVLRHQIDRSRPPDRLGDLGRARCQGGMLGVAAVTRPELRRSRGGCDRSHSQDREPTEERTGRSTARSVDRASLMRLLAELPTSA